MKPIREGVLCGLVGAGALALWFLIVDILAGQPLHTPAALGAGLFRGVDAGREAAVGNGPAPALVLGYTLFHVAVFAVVGVILAHAAEMIEREHAIVLVVFFALFVFFEFGYFVFAVAFVQRVLEHLSWPALLIGNALAAGAMAGYLYWRHPALHFKMELHLNA